VTSALPPVPDHQQDSQDGERYQDDQDEGHCHPPIRRSPGVCTRAYPRRYFQTGGALARRHAYARGPDVNQESSRIMMCAGTSIGRLQPPLNQCVPSPHRLHTVSTCPAREHRSGVRSACDSERVTAVTRRLERVRTATTTRTITRPVAAGRNSVFAGVRCVVRDRIELSTFRFSGQPR
jgi:hypothetical protein